jgi:hypothetical protein
MPGASPVTAYSLQKQHSTFGTRPELKVQPFKEGKTRKLQLELKRLLFVGTESTSLRGQHALP